jgi:riboflavin kinase/FMN adenylyltransferase
MIFKSKVIHGNKHGADIGYPTANLEVNYELKNALQKPGVYAVKVVLDDMEYGGALFWGKRSLFHDRESVCEVLIIDFTDDIYDKEVSVEVISFIRDIIQVASEDELKQLIREDISKAKTLIDNK